MNNIVGGGGVRLGPLSFEKKGLETLKLCMLSRPEFILLQAQINDHGHKVRNFYCQSLPRFLGVHRRHLGRRFTYD